MKKFSFNKNYIWNVRLKNLPFWQRFLVRSSRILDMIICDLRAGQLSLMAMSLVYTTIISLVPLLALCFSVLKGFGAHNQIKPMLYNLLEPMGDKGVEISDNIITFVDNIQVGVLGSVGLALLIYSVVSMMQKIERAFNYTWHISKGRTFAERFSDYLSVLLIGPLFIFLSVGMTASVQHTEVLDHISSVPGVTFVLEVIGFTIPYFVLGLGFAFIYSFMPNTKVKPLSAFVGGIVTAFIWKSMGLIFSAFVANSASHTAIYSAFASLIAFMIWLYLGWLVLLIGASIAYYHQKNPKSLLVREDNPKLSNRFREKLGLHIMYLISKSFDSNSEPWNINRFSNSIDAPVHIINEVLGVLEDSKLIHLDDKDSCYYPTRSLDKINLNDVMFALRHANERDNLPLNKIGNEKAVEKIFLDFEKSAERELKKHTLKKLVRSK